MRDFSQGTWFDLFCVGLVNAATAYAHGLVAHVDGNVILINHRVAGGVNRNHRCTRAHSRYQSVGAHGSHRCIAALPCKACTPHHKAVLGRQLQCAGGAKERCRHH